VFRHHAPVLRQLRVHRAEARAAQTPAGQL